MAWPLGATVSFAVLLALAGVVLSVSILSGGGSRGEAPPSADVVVDAFSVRDGPDESTVEVEAAVTVTNPGDRAIFYAPGDFGLLTTASKTPIDVALSTLHAGDLPPRGAIDGRLVFVAPAGGVPVALVLRDAAGGPSRALALEP